MISGNRSSPLLPIAARADGPHGRGLPELQPVLRTAVKHRRWPRFLALYCVAQGLSFVLYAFLGKGYAYAGVKPVFVGEALLLFATLTLLFSRKLLGLLTSPTGVLLTIFLLWQLACAIPYYGLYGIDVLRDGVLWAYAVFAWVTAALTLRLTDFPDDVIRWFRRFGGSFIFVGPAAFLVYTYFEYSLPHWPGTGVAIPTVKGDEYCCHLAGIFAFVMAGFAPRQQWWIFLLLSDALLSAGNRGGLIAFGFTAAFVMILRPKVERVFMVLGIATSVFLAMIVFDVHIKIHRTDRDISADQLIQNVKGLVGYTDAGNYSSDRTKQWRLQWWSKIIDYTVFGPYFWQGKGYGINLADSDGFQVTAEHSLRNPHNSHITFLARSGVPGFLLWLALQLTWAAMLFSSYRRSRLMGLPLWSGLFLWLFAYWLSYMVAASFDVFLEGPMGGIPFWIIFGFGWGCHLKFEAHARLLTAPVHQRVAPPIVEIRRFHLDNATNE